MHSRNKVAVGTVALVQQQLLVPGHCMCSQAKAEHSSPIRRLPFASKIGKKQGRKALLPSFPPWIVHDFSKNIQIIANHQLQYLIFVLWHAKVVCSSQSFLKGQLKLQQQVDGGGALKKLWFEHLMSDHVQERLTPPL
jgi:hypothetical protein